MITHLTLRHEYRIHIQTNFTTSNVEGVEVMADQHPSHAIEPSCDALAKENLLNFDSTSSDYFKLTINISFRKWFNERQSKKIAF